ncbi:hypothetical protein ACOMHN_050620 [Nucella lapillus]
MDDGSLAADLPVFIIRVKKKVNYFPKAVLCLQHRVKIVKGIRVSEAHANSKYKKNARPQKARPQKIYITNTDWQDGTVSNHHGGGLPCRRPLFPGTLAGKVPPLD